MKTVLGLDLGTNSIGWALVNKATKLENDKITELNEGEIIGLGSRIIPMSQDILGEFDKGNSVSQTAARTGYAKRKVTTSIKCIRFFAKSFCRKIRCLWKVFKWR